MSKRLWNKRGLPHKGWTLQHEEDTEVAEHTCEMCGKTEIRYVHHMKHPNGHRVKVGGNCAVKLTDDYKEQEKIKNLDKAMKKTAAKNKRLQTEKNEWLTKPWIRFKTGDVYRTSKNIYAHIKLRPSGWRYQGYVLIGDLSKKIRSMNEGQVVSQIEQAVKDYNFYNNSAKYDKRTNTSTPE